MFQFVGSVVKWCLLLVAVCAAVGVPYFYTHVDDEICRRIEHLLGEKYPRLVVSVRSAQLVKGEGILARGISIFEPGAVGPQPELLAIDELFIECNTDVVDLVRSGVDIRSVSLRRPTLRATRRPDGTWSAAQLLPLPKFGKRPPRASVEDGVIEIFDPLKNPTATLTLRGANFRIAPAEPAADWPAGMRAVRVEGRCSSDRARQIEIDATLDPSGRIALINGQAEGLEFCPELYRVATLEPSGPWLAVESLRARASAHFRVHYRAGAPVPLDYEINGQVREGRLEDSRLPYAFSEIRADFGCNLRGWRVTGLTARSGQTTVKLDAESTGHGPSSPLRVRAELRHLALDLNLVQVLPAAWRLQWQKFLPSGEIDVDANLAFDGRAWQPEATVRCREMSLVYHRFPYRLERGSGTMVLKDKLLRTNLSCFHDSAAVHITSELELGPSPPPGWVEVNAEGVRLDDKLLAAMPIRSRQVIGELNPAGTMDVAYRMWQEKAPGTPPHQAATVTLNRCAIKYERFRYPLAEIEGKLQMHDGLWTLAGLSGSNGTARVACTGTISTGSAGHGEYQLHFAAGGVPLDDQLRDALSPGVQRLWNDIKPRGIVDLQTEFRYAAGMAAPQIRVRVQPVLDTVSIEPARFPYRLERLRGDFSFADGHATLANLRAEHGRTTVIGRGVCDLQSDGGWRLHLEQMHVDRLRADRDLVQALPERLKKILSELHLSSPVNLRGAFDLASRPVAAEGLSAAWNVRLDLQQTGVTVGVRLEHVNGSVAMAGGFDGRRFHCQGDVSLDSVVFKDAQFTEVMGPFWIDDTQLLVGRWADRLRQAQPERRITSKFYSGTMVADGWMIFGPQPRYNFQATVSQADLARVTQEMIPGRRPLSGDIQASVELRGKGTSVNDLAGRGNIQLRHADIYQLPLMISLLKLLSVRPPDTTAFTASDIDFYIQGEHIYVDRIDFSGDAISMLGKGELNFNRQIHLTFHAMVGKGARRLPLVSDLLGGASQQIMQIHAEGTLDQPSLRREAFPGVNWAWQQLQAELYPRDQSPRHMGDAPTASSAATKP